MIPIAGGIESSHTHREGGRTVTGGLEQGGMESYCLMDVSVWEDEVLERDSGDGCTTIKIYLCH